MLGALQMADSSSEIGDTSPRRSASRQRALFLRRFREVGQVRAAAALAGVARSTLYRWREKDAQFRARWETYDEMRRHDAEEHLERLMREGEKTTAFYKGQAVGWKVSFTARPAIGLLASQDRREKLRQREREWEARRASVSHSRTRVQTNNPVVSTPSPDETPRKKAPRAADPAPVQLPGAIAKKPVLVSHSGGLVQSERRAASKAWSERLLRKTPPLAYVPHRLQDDWSLPSELRREFWRPDGRFDQALPVRPPAAGILSTALLRRAMPAGATGC